MPKMVNPRLLNGSLIVFVVIIGIIVVSTFFVWQGPPPDSWGESLTDSEEDGLRALPDTTVLTYSAFNAYEQNRKNVQSYQERKDKGIGSGFTMPFLGFRTFRECDTCTMMIFAMKQPPAKYYLELPGYRSTEWLNHFYVKAGKYFLKYPVWDKETESQRIGHYARKELPFRYSYTGTNQWQVERASVLIPLTKKKYDLLVIPAQVLLYIAMLVLLYISFAIPAKILLRISRGQIFTQQHVKQLHIVAWTLLSIPFLVIAFQYLLRWLFSSYITNDVQLAPLNVLRDYRSTLIIGITVLAIAKAFKRGLSLQKDQDLTI